MNEAGEGGAQGSAGLARTLAARHVTMIAFGGVIGAGLFIGSSGAIARGGPGVFVVYGACGFLVFLIMRMLGEMAVADPGRGSFAEYAARALGPWAGALTRWLYWYFWVFTVGAETVAGAKLLHAFGLPAPVWAIGLGLIAVMSLANMASVRAFGELEFWFSLVKVAAIAVFIAVGAVFVVLARGGPPHAAALLTGDGGLFPHGWGGLVAAAPVVIFSLMGSEVATIAAAESTDPAGNVARAARTVALRIMIFYVASILVIAAILPWRSITPGASPFEGALRAMGAPWAGTAMAVVIVTAVLSCLNSGLYITSRMLFELARAGDAPRFAAITSRSGAPIAGAAVGCAAGAAAALAQVFLAQDVFTLLASTSGDIVLFVYLVIAAAQIAERRRAEAAGLTPALPFWFFPWLSYAVIAAIVAIIVLLALIPDQRATLALSAATVAVAFGLLALKSALAGRPAIQLAQREGG